MQLPNSLIYVPENSYETMQAREWADHLCIVHEVFNPVTGTCNL